VPVFATKYKWKEELREEDKETRKGSAHNKISGPTRNIKGILKYKIVLRHSLTTILKCKESFVCPVISIHCG
jgi:hypothetical protein